MTTTSEASVAVPRISEFQWNKDHKLSWDDFRGPVNGATDESAAATHCGIGFKTSLAVAGKQPQVIVYNRFYTDRSWVRPDAKLPSILEHEQGHFDLCELYTRKLRHRMDLITFGQTGDMRQLLYNIYNEVNDEYERRQQAYEYETTHGTNLPEQKRWQSMIAAELAPAAVSTAMSATALTRQ